MRDLLPALRATDGWTQEKVEGLAVAANGRAYAVTDNDGVDDNTGETIFLNLGPSALTSRGAGPPAWARPPSPPGARASPIGHGPFTCGA